MLSSLSDRSYKDQTYTGRFAPSPSGPLHWGSLYTALASFLQAKHQHGQWLIRIDDLDIPRIIPGSAENILSTLETLELHWDGPVVYQSVRLQQYQSALNQLSKLGILYPCRCARKRLKEYREKNPGKPAYPGFCRNLNLSTEASYSLRIKTDQTAISFTDLLQGDCSACLSDTDGDFIILRRDQIIAYQLAVVIDDQDAGITEIVRGYDLLDSTFKQIYLQQKLAISNVSYCHIPIIVDEQGYKLSKQSFAEPVKCHTPGKVIYNLLLQLKQQPPRTLLGASVTELLDWAITHWDIQRLSHMKSQQQLINSTNDSITSN